MKNKTPVHFLLLSLFYFANLVVAEERPHIILMLADDLGWADVSYHGGNISTPNIDSLAKRGTQLDQFYVLPICSPTRSALMTGRYPIRLGLQCGVVRPWATHGLPLDEKTLPQGLKQVGYTTSIVGKWHLGHALPEQLPLQRGFDHHYGHYNGALDYFTHLRDGGLDWHRDGQPNFDEGYTTDLIGQEAARIIQNHNPDQPLFLYVPFNAPHDPLQAPQDQLDRNKHIKEERRQLFAGMVTSMDDAVGRIVGAANQRLPKDNTLIIFCSDNGGIPQNGSNGPLRAGKSTLYEGGVRVTSIMAWDGTIKAGSIVNEPLHMVDIYPTLMGLTGSKPQQTKPLDGKDAWATIIGEKKSPHKFILINVTPFAGAIRMGDWKLVHNGQTVGSATTAMGEEQWELFNLKQDPFEKNNLIDEQPKVFQRLKKKLAELKGDAVAPNIVSNLLPPDFDVPKIW
jgi:arylsulfatase A-like enzyme